MTTNTTSNHDDRDEMGEAITEEMSAIELDRMRLAANIQMAIEESPVQTAEYYHHGWTTRVQIQDGWYKVTTSNSVRVVFSQRHETLEAAAYACECNEWQGGDLAGWVPAGR